MKDLDLLTHIDNVNRLTAQLDEANLTFNNVCLKHLCKNKALSWKFRAKKRWIEANRKRCEAIKELRSYKISTPIEMRHKYYEYLRSVK